MPLLGGQRLDNEESATFAVTDRHYGYFTKMFYAVCPRLLQSAYVMLLLLHDCTGGESDHDSIAGHIMPNTLLTVYMLFYLLYE